MKNSTLATDLNSENLMALLDKDDQTNRLLAKHPNASSELLEKLSHSSDKPTRQGVASNPNTPTETFVKLGQQFPKEFLANPALDLLLLENPGLMEQVPQSLLIRLVKQADCPSSMLNWAASHENAKVQMAVAMNVSAPEFALQRLRESQHKAIRNAVLQQSVNLFDQDPEKAFETAVSERIGSLSIEEISEAISNADIGAAQWTAQPLLCRLAISNGGPIFSPIGLARILKDTPLSVDAIKNVLLNYPRWLDVAFENLTPNIYKIQILTEYSKHPNKYKRINVARNIATPADVLALMAEDEDQEVQLYVAANPNTPLENILDFASIEQFKEAVAKNESAPDQILAELSLNEKTAVRGNVAGNPKTSLETLKVLLNDNEEYVRACVIENPNATQLIKVDSIKLIQFEVRLEMIARNKNTPAEILEYLSKNESVEVRKKVACNPSTSVHVIEYLSDDSASEVRRSLALNPSTPSSILEKLSQDNDIAVATSTAWHPQTSASILEKFAKLKDIPIKLALAEHPNTPLNILLNLLKQKDVKIRKKLTFHSQQYPEIREALLKDSEGEVRISIFKCVDLSSETLEQLVNQTSLENELQVLLEHPNLSTKLVEVISNQLFFTGPLESAWFLNRLKTASPETIKAIKDGNIFHYYGSDPNKAVLAKRELAPLMALCSGPFVEPNRIARVVGSSDWLIRAAVARNTGTPPNLIKKLITDAHPLVAALAKNAQIKNLQNLKESKNSEQKKIDSAKLPNLSRAQNEVLSRLRKLISKRPLLIMDLASDEIWFGKLNASEQMTGLTHLGRFEIVLPQLLKILSPQETGAFWEIGAKSEDKKLRVILARQTECPEIILKKFAKDSDPDVMMSAMSNASLQQKDKDLFIKKWNALSGQKLDSILKHPLVSKRFLEENQDGEDWVRCAISENPSTPSLVLEKLSKDLDEIVRWGVAKNPSAPFTALARLSKAEEIWIRQSVAGNPSSSDKTLSELARDSEPIVRSAVASNPLTPISVLEALSKNSVQNALVFNPTTPLNLKLKLFKELTNNDSLSGMSVGSFSRVNSPDILEIVAKDNDQYVQLTVAGNESTPATVLEVFANSSDPLIRHHVGNNIAAPKYLLDKLAKDQDANVRKGVAKNTSTPKDLLVQLAKDMDQDVRANAKFNTSLPSELRHGAIQDLAFQMQQALIQECSSQETDAAVSIREITFKSIRDAFQLINGAYHQHDLKSLTKASRSKDWLTRLEAALHTDSSAGILKFLMKDSDPEVANAAQFRMTTFAS